MYLDFYLFLVSFLFYYIVIMYSIWIIFYFY